jgi:hypothetical protein
MQRARSVRPWSEKPENGRGISARTCPRCCMIALQRAPAGPVVRSILSSATPTYSGRIICQADHPVSLRVRQPAPRGDRFPKPMTSPTRNEHTNDRGQFLRLRRLRRDRGDVAQGNAQHAGGDGQRFGDARVARTARCRSGATMTSKPFRDGGDYRAEQWTPLPVVPLVVADFFAFGRPQLLCAQRMVRRLSCGIDVRQHI